MSNASEIALRTHDRHYRHLDLQVEKTLGTRDPGHSIRELGIVFHSSLAMDAENNSNRLKKRERGPYLSYLTNPLKEKVPRSTLRFWSRESHEGNAGKSLESCGLEHTSALSAMRSSKKPEKCYCQ